jgi:hypothetical protein
LCMLNHMLKLVIVKRSLKWGEVIQVFNFFNNYFINIVNCYHLKQFCTWWLESFIISLLKFQIVILTTLFRNFQHVRKGTSVLCTWRSFKDWAGGGTKFHEMTSCNHPSYGECIMYLNNCPRVLAQLYLKICTILFNYDFIK